MTGILATTGSTINAVLNTVATSANTVSRSVTGISTSLDMLEAYISLARAKQVDAHKVELSTYRTRLIEETSGLEQRRQEALALEFHSTPQRKAHYDAIHANLSALFAE